MNHHRHWGASLLLVTCLAMMFPGCTADQRHARHIGRADRYFEEGLYEEALIEYVNAFRLKQADPVTVRQIGLTEFAMGDLEGAFPFLLKAESLEPENLEVKQRLGEVFLVYQAWEQARSMALAVLSSRPADFDAFILLIDADIGAESFATALAQLEEAREKYEGEPLFHIALGNVYVRKGELDEAEAAYQQAESLGVDPARRSRALGLLYRAKGQPSRAEESYRRAIELNPRDYYARLLLAAVRIEQDDIQGAEDILETLTDEAPGYAPGWFSRAELVFHQGRPGESLELLDRIPERFGRGLAVALLRGRALLDTGAVEEGVRELQRTTERFSRSARLRYELARALVRAGEAEEALREAEQALGIQPDSRPIQLLAAELHLKTGKAKEAVSRLEEMVSTAPDFVPAYLLLGNAYRVLNDPVRAEQAYRKVTEHAPNRADALHLLGMALRAQERNVEAARLFQRAVELEPGFAQPLEQLVILDLARKDFDTALRRVRSQIELAPDNTALRYLVAQVHASRRDFDEAEAAFLDVLELEPGFIGAYLRLSSLYAVAGKEEDALRKLQEALEVNKEDLASLVLAGILYQQKGDAAMAAEMYERALAVEPNTAVAANNLAFVYSKDPAKKERAYELALHARKLMPAEPHIKDTLGWILARRGNHAWALNLLQESAAKLGDDPDVQHHLGMTHYYLGNETRARTHLGRAVEVSEDFDGVEDVRELLSVLRIDPDASGPESVDLLNRMLEKDPSHPAALIRVAARAVREGRAAEAMRHYEDALAVNPSYTPAVLGLALLHARDTGDLKKAMALAQKAHEEDPHDPDVADVMGWVLYRQGDYGWAFTLFLESTEARPDDPDMLYRLGLAHYMLGRAETARDTVGSALALPGPFRQAADARRFLAMTDLYNGMEDPEQAREMAAAALEEEPGCVPALMVLAAAHEAMGDRGAAEAAYQQILDERPGFARAAQKVADLNLDAAGDHEKAFAVAMKARSLLPKDPGVAQTLGCAVFRQGDYEWAARLLEESARARAEDPGNMLYRGMCYFRLGKTEEAREVLVRALRRQPDHPAAGEAREMLEQF